MCFSSCLLRGFSLLCYHAIKREAVVPKVTGAKKQVLVRLPEKTYERLLLESTKETMKRGKPVSVPVLITERLERSFNEDQEK